MVTPATLSIETAQVLPPPTTLEIVPSLGFESLDFVDEMPPLPDDNDPGTLRFAYTIPSREVIEVVKAVAATGSILPITPPSPNASWALAFSGPALQCSDIPEPQSSAIRSNIASATNASSPCTAYGYVAWLEGLPFLNGSNASDSTLGGYAFNERIYQGTSMPAVLYLAASPESVSIESHNASPVACDEPIERLFDPDAGAVLMQCELNSRSYRTNFTYVNGIQDVRVETEVLGGSNIQTISSVNCTAPNGTDGSCNFTADTLRTLSYQAIMDAVTYLITGFVNAKQNDTAPFISTQVISTALISTPELHFLAQPILAQDSSAGARTLQQNIQTWRGTKDEGLVNTNDRMTSRPLAETIEMLFQNATVSMMSQAHLLQVPFAVETWVE